MTTASGGCIARVTVSWNENTASGRILNVYGSSVAYQSASDLYDNTKSGALLGTIVYGETNSLSISSVYPYVGVRSADGAIYLNNIGFKWGSEEIQTKTSQILSFSDDNFEITIGDDFTPPTLSGAQTTVTYTSNNESVAQVNASTGSVQIKGVGKATITATAVENDEYYSANISYRIEVKSKGGVYSLVESALSDWRGDYLIAYSDDVFMNGSLEGGASGVGSAQSHVSPESSLSLDKKSIEASWGDQYYVIIEAIDDSDLSNGYVIKSHSSTSPYFYHTNNTKNGISGTATKSTAANYPITITFVSSSDVQLKLGGNATGSILHYNATVGQSGEMFRFYKDGGQSPIYLYKKQTTN